MRDRRSTPKPSTRRRGGAARGPVGGAARDPANGVRSRASTLGPQDAEIVARLERDGRLSYADLGEHVGLSKSPTWSRVRALEERGVITGYRAIVEPAAIGLDIHAFVQVTIRSTMSREFEQAVVRHVAVLECYTTAGQADYLLHVLVANVAALDTLLRNELSRMPGVEHVATTVGMKTIKARGYVTECAAAQS